MARSTCKSSSITKSIGSCFAIVNYVKEILLKRKTDHESCFTRNRLQINRAFVLLYNSLYYIQSQTSTLANIFCGIKGIEYPRLNVVRHPRAIISNASLHTFAIPPGGYLQHALAVIFHSIQCIINT